MRFIGIDPSTKTGLVILDEQGEVDIAIEVTENLPDPYRFLSISRKVINLLGRTPVIAIEGFSFGSRGNAVSIQYGIGWIMRAMLVENGYRDYLEVAPTMLKRFASGKGNTKKDELAVEIYKRWGFEHKSDNVRDAYVLAQIARYKHLELDMTKFQKEVISKLG